MKRFVISLIICACSLSLKAQSDVNLSKELMFYGDIMVNTLEASSRTRAGVEFKKFFEDYLKDRDSVEDTEFLKFTSTIEAPDNEFTLITWQVRRDSFEFNFEGYLLKKDGTIINLNRTGLLGSDAAYQTCTQDDWYGCIYTSIKKLGEDKYLLFGFDASTQFDNQKLVDPLTISDSGLQFGAPIIEDKESLGTFVNTLVISYASDATVSLNYNKGLDVIIQDHLEPRLGLQAGQGVTNIPDGTYEGYYLDNGKWMYKAKLYDHVYKDAPRPKPVFDNSEKEK